MKVPDASMIRKDERIDEKRSDDAVANISTNTLTCACAIYSPYCDLLSSPQRNDDDL